MTDQCSVCGGAFGAGPGHRRIAFEDGLGASSSLGDTQTRYPCQLGLYQVGLSPLGKATDA